jgi:hypothetical protein
MQLLKNLLLKTKGEPYAYATRSGVERNSATSISGEKEDIGI